MVQPEQVWLTAVLDHFDLHTKPPAEIAALQLWLMWKCCVDARAAIAHLQTAGSKWPGQNLLGRVLMEVRTYIRRDLQDGTVQMFHDELHNPQDARASASVPSP